VYIYIYIYIYIYKIKVRGVAQSVPGGLGSQVSMTFST